MALIKTGKGDTNALTKGVTLIQTAAKAGDPDALVNLAYLYEVGLGVTPSRLLKKSHATLNTTS